MAAKIINQHTELFLKLLHTINQDQSPFIKKGKALRKASSNTFGITMLNQLVRITKILWICILCQSNKSHKTLVLQNLLLSDVTYTDMRCKKRKMIAFFFMDHSLDFLLSFYCHCETTCLNFTLCLPKLCSHKLIEVQSQFKFRFLICAS